MKKRGFRTIGIVLAALIVFGGLCAGYYFAFMDPYRGTIKNPAASPALDTPMTRQEAEEDLRYLYDHLKSRHPAWLDGSTELTRAVDRQLQTELAGLGNSVTVLDLSRAAGRIAAQLHDGHTWVRWNNPEAPRYIDDFAQARAYGPPASVNGVPTEDLFATYLSMTSYELEFYAKARFQNSVLFEEAPLRMCGVDTAQGIDMSFQTADGPVARHYDFVPIEQVAGYEPNQNERKWVEYSIDAERSLGIFTLRSCDMNAEYAKALDEFFAEVFANGIENIAVDLRGNGGGNSQVAGEFLKYIDVDSYASWDNAVRFGWYLWKNTDVVCVNRKKPVTFDGNLFVLTDAYTFSSAMDFAMLIGDNRLGVLVGGTSGNSPDGYGDCLFFQMPNSKNLISVSYKRWYRLDKTKLGEPLTPDYEVPPAEALDKVYELIGA
ncbi:MAG TPA: S41 family peptidase [Clostridia bacterium]|nr:S41 family peptidase [Clostridia bacterium]